MRISDWSSDVCSSDLGRGAEREAGVVDQHVDVAERCGDRIQPGLPRVGVADVEGGRVHDVGADAFDQLLQAVDAAAGGADAPAGAGETLDDGGTESGAGAGDEDGDRTRTRLNSSHYLASRMQSSA